MSGAAPSPELTGAQRRFLRARAHPLRPVVHVGEGGLTEGLRAALDQALLDLYKAGTITLDEAMSHADSRADLEAKVNFGG